MLLHIKGSTYSFISALGTTPVEDGLSR